MTLFDEFRCMDENQPNVFDMTSPMEMKATRANTDIVFVDLAGADGEEAKPVKKNATTNAPALLEKQIVADMHPVAATEPVKPPRRNAGNPRPPRAAAAAPKQPRQPSLSKIEKDFEKLPIDKRIELLSKWNEETPIPLATAAPAASSSSSSCSEELELYHLRLQLGETVSKIQELQSKEKKLKMSIKKLQRRVAAAYCTGTAPLPFL